MVPFPELVMGHGLHTPPPVPMRDSLEGHLRKKHSPADAVVLCSDLAAKGVGWGEAGRRNRT